MEAIVASDGDVILTRAPLPDRSYSDPEFEPFWRALVEHNMPVNIHVGGGSGSSPFSFSPGAILSGMVGSKLVMGQIIAGFVFEGVLQSHPDVKLVSVECGVGWLPFLAEYMDNIWGRHRYWTESQLKERPSFYMDRQVYGIFLDDKLGVRLRNETGGRNSMWSSDYPHSESSFPHSMKLIEEHFAGVPDDEKHRIICGTCAELYGLA